MPAFARLLRHPIRVAHHHHYKVLLASLLLLVLGSGLAPASADPDLFAALVLQNMLVGVLVLAGRRRRLLVGGILVTALAEAAVARLGWPTVRPLLGITYCTFCVVVTYRILRKLLTARQVTPEVLAASMCGFVLLGMVGTFAFLLIDLVQPGAFQGVGPAPTAGTVQTLNYFSFTTLLTVGFGDVVPLSGVARKATVLLGLLGHFYDLFVVGVVVGKYVGSLPTRPALAAAGPVPAAPGLTPPQPANGPVLTAAAPAAAPAPGAVDAGAPAGAA